VGAMHLNEGVVVTHSSFKYDSTFYKLYYDF